MKKMFLLFVFLMLAGVMTASAQLFIEDFNYTAGDTLGKYWVWHSGGVGQDTIQSGGLSFYQYASSGVGNSVKINTGATEDLHKNFPSFASSGAVYTSFLVKVANVNTTGDYFFHLGETPFSSFNLRGRISVKADASGNLAFGLSKSSSVASSTFTPFSYSKDSTYLLVLKYIMSPVSSTDDSVALFIFSDSTLTPAEPDTAAIGPINDGTTDLVNVGAVGIRQGTAANVQTMLIDGIRVGTSWSTSAGGVVEPIVTIAPKSIDFGKLNLGSSKTDTITVKNFGYASLNITAVTSSDPDFVVDPATATVATLDSQKFAVTYTPSVAAANAGSIVFVSNNPTSPDTVSVAGSGIQAGFSLAPKQLNFGNVWKDSTKFDSAVVTNVSTSAHLLVDSVVSSNPLFVVNPTTADIDTSASATFTISFSPLAEGAQAGTIIFYHNAPSLQDTLAVSGNGIEKKPKFLSTPAVLNFHNVMLGKSKMDSITVKNIGYDSLKISDVASSNNLFVITPTSVDLDSMESAKFYVTFTPSAVGIQSTELVFTSNVDEVKDTVKSYGSGVDVISIAEAKVDVNSDLIPDRLAPKDTMVIKGVVTTQNMGASAGQTSYFVQDTSAGIDVFFFGTTTTEYQRGDTVMVTGTLAQYRGLTEFMPLVLDDTHFKILGHGDVPDPVLLTAHEYTLNAEKYEGMLIQIDTLHKVSGTWPTVAANASIYLTNPSNSDTIQMFLDIDANIAGPVEPTYPISVVGILSQYSSASGVYNNGYEIAPRDTDDITEMTIVGVANLNSGIPDQYQLFNNYPNPFNPTTTIKFGLPQTSNVTIKIFDVIGREVMTLVHDQLQAGYHTSILNAAGMASGMYIYRITASSVAGHSSFTQVKKMLLLK